MKYHAFLISFLTILLSSCVTKKPFISTQNKHTPISSPRAASIATNNSLAVNNRALPTIKYIDRYKAVAISEMNKYGIPASIKLAQGILESNNGNSNLAIQANNHFGIKCTSAWSGKTILQDDDQKDECFRVYRTPEDSFRDHSEFLKRKRYAFLFELDKNDYEGWAKGLKQAGYATNPRYPDLLINLIRRYNLDQYDTEETSIEKDKRESVVLAEITREQPKQQKEEAVKSPVVMKIYEVKRGDTLYSIAKNFTLSVDDLRTINNLSGNNLKLGQLLLVSK